jgi:hypothetical protein
VDLPWLAGKWNKKVFQGMVHSGGIRKKRKTMDEQDGVHKAKEMENMV